MKSFEVVSVNISEKKGTVKHPVPSAQLNARGVENDAHAGNWHRQVSLLALESIKKAEKQAKTEFPLGVFAENITTKGIEIHKTNILDRFVGEEVEMEVTQIGKKCHAKCAIGKLVGDCIMPLEGIFTRVLKGGEIKAGDSFTYVQKIFRVKIITLSDRASTGEYEDKSGPEIQKLCTAWGEEKRLLLDFDAVIIPDEKDLLEQAMKESFDEEYDMIFTTGSTGIGERDIAPEVIQSLLDKEIPGIMELIRVKYGMEKPNALLSRSICGVKNRSLVFVLPGNPKAVREYMNEISKVLFHSILMLHNIGAH